jgi:Spy/CpxP family protein refolding chaperone
MTKKIIILLITGLMLAMAYFTMDAQMMPQRMMEHARFGIMLVDKNLFPAPVLLKHKDDIGLTAEQVGKIEKMQVQQQETFIKKQAEINVKELKLGTFLKEDKIDRGKLEGMIQEIGKMRTDLQVQHINHLLDLRDLLTADQLKKLENFKEDRMRERMGKRMMRMKERMGDRKMRGDEPPTEEPPHQE